MSGVFSSPKKPKIVQQEAIEETEQIKEDESAAKEREKRKQILTPGKQSTVLSGIATQLKKRLGE